MDWIKSSGYYCRNIEWDIRDNVGIDAPATEI